MSTPLTVRTERASRRAGRAASPPGRSTPATWPTSPKRSAPGPTDTTDTLTVDLSAVDYLDSAAINALAPHAESLQIIANPVLMRVLLVSGLAELAKIRPASDT